MSNEIEKTEQKPLAVPDAGALTAAFGGDKGLNVPVGAVLPIVKILRESPKFEMPDGNTVENFRGHILHYHSVNQLYLKEYGADNVGQRPDCSSFDGLIPCSGFYDRYTFSYEDWCKLIDETNGPANLKDIDPAHPLAQTYCNKVARTIANTEGLEKIGLEPDEKVGSCSSCPAFQFGSKNISDNSKACASYIWLYILIDGYKLPIFLKAGPASLSKKDSLIPFLSNAPNIGLEGMYQTISIQFSLTTKSFASGFNASSLKLSDPKVLSTDDPAQLEKLHYLIGMYKSFNEKYLESMKNFVSQDTDNDSHLAPAEDDNF